MATRSSMPPDPGRKPKQDGALSIIDGATALAAHLASGRIHPAYLVTSGEIEDRGRSEERPGADPQALLEAARAIERAALVGGDAALDLVRIDYLDGEFLGQGLHFAISQEARSVSLFGGRRVVTVLHADKLDFDAGKGKSGAKVKSRKDLGGEDPLEALIDNVRELPSGPPFVLIFVAEHFDRRRRAFKLLAQAGAVVEVAPLTPITLQNYIETLASQWHIKVERGVGQRIWDRLGGSDASRLRQTADRLLLDAGSDGSVTVRHVESAVPMDRDAAVWAITEALAVEDVTRALTVLNLLLDHAAPSQRDGEALKMMGFLTSHYTALLRLASAWAHKVPESQIAAETGMHPFRLQNLARQLRAMKPGRLELAIAALDAADAILKSSAIGERRMAVTRWMEQLLISLARGVPLRLRTGQSVMDTI